MSRIRDFFIKLPAVCGAPNAEAYGRMNELAFDDELKNPSGEFASRPDISIRERIAPAFGFARSARVNRKRAEFAEDLAYLAAASYALNAKGHGDSAGLDELAARLEGESFPEVTALLTVQEARTLGNWA